ncbi:MAG: sigma-54 dependent transcriptional regulator [Pseudomonadota bacterium]
MSDTENPRATILVVEDDADLSEALCATLTDAGYRVLTATDGSAALTLASEHPVQLVLSDVQMQPMDGLELLGDIRDQHPGLPVILMTAYASVPRAVAAMQLGAETYLVKPFDTRELIDTVSRTLSRHRSLSVTGVDTGTVVCGDADTVSLLGIAARVANCDATVLLSGESGAGKEVFARFIHNRSPRAEKPWVAINCAAIPEQMLEATLFGYERGAFTGAQQARPGKFEQADGGTLLLDEISEMDLGLQAKLLRVLQEREVERLGATRSKTVDVRVLATTNRNLAAEVEAGRFREDLYYRLNVFPLHIPPLRERRGDVLPLFRHFLTRYCEGQRARPTLTARAEKRLLAHGWPGNVRELDNLVQRILILLAGDTITDSDLVFETAGTAPVHTTQIAPAPTTTSAGDLRHDLRDEERRRIVDALEAGSGNRTEAARTLGISPRTLRYKIARLREAGYTIPDRQPRYGARPSVA